MNVDTAVRILTETCTDAFNKKDMNYKKHLIDEFISLDEKVKPVSFRNKNRKQIEEYFLNSNESLKDTLLDICECDEIIEIKEDSIDNKVGSDLIVKLKYDNDVSNQKIELKFGAETNKNIGIEAFDKIFINLNEEDYFKNKFSEIKNNQRRYADRHPRDFDGLIKNLKNEIDILSEDCNELADSDNLIIDSEEMNTNLSTTGSIANNSGSKPFKKIRMDYDDIIEIDILDYSGNWKFTDISSLPDKDKARIQFWVSNSKTKVKFLSNNKNDYNYNGTKYPAKTGLGSYCFNVWAYKEK